MTDPMYATEEDLDTYEGIIFDTPEDANRAIHKASIVVQGELRTARYLVDEDGNPVDVGVTAKLAEATAAQVKWFEDTGDTSGSSAQASGGSIGGVSMPNVTSDGTAKSKRQSRISPEMVEILRAADCLSWGVGY